MVEESALFIQRGFSSEQVIETYWKNPKKSFIADCFHAFFDEFIKSLWNKTVPFALKSLRAKGIDPADYAAFMRMKRRQRK